MLDLDQRQLFLEAIKPPIGYHFDRGIGTTFTLDLTALLSVPLSFALLDHTEDPETQMDPLLLLESLRKFSDRLTIFCQAGRISIPRRYNHLYHYLENQVVEVQAPEGGVFHPKVWLLRYNNEDDDTVLYRLLVMSRNLTFDKSWDLMVQLEGNLVERQLAYSRNNPLGDFIEALTTIAINSVSPEILTAINQLQEQVRRVNFTTSYPFTQEFRFHPLGIPGYRRGFIFDCYYDRALVISPFIEDNILQRIGATGRNHVLVSETEAIDVLKPETLELYEEVFNLDNSIWDDEKEVDKAKDRLSPPSGLHAKLFILNHSWDSTWFVGSANATSRALQGFKNRNVEFMLEFNGRRSDIGIDKVLGDAEDVMSFRNLLRAYQQPETKEPVDQDKIDSEMLAEQIRNWIVSSQYKLEVVPTGNNNVYDLLLKTTSQNPLPDGEFTIHCWPISLRETHHIQLNPKTPQHTIPDVSILALTPFMAFTIRTCVGKAVLNTQFVLQLPVKGMPTHREDHLIRAIISNQAQFLRFLRIILSQDPSELWRDPSWLDGSAPSTETSGSAELDLPLLEELLRTLSRAPEKIERIQQIVKHLLKTPEGRSVLPEGFEPIWSQFVEANRGMK